MQIKKVFHSPIGITTLTEKFTSYTIAESYNSFWSGERITDHEQSG
jgi:hypothetical protein